MTSPFISIVTVVLNDPEGLARTIDSLTAQSYQNWEYIVIDGGSDAETLDVIKKKAEVISKLHTEGDNGIYDAMNKGVSMSSGQYIMFMNAGDDFAGTRVLSDSEYFLKEHPSVEVMLGGTFQNIGHCVFYRPPKNISWIDYGLPAFHQSTIYKSDLLHAKKYDRDFPLLADYAWLASHCVSGVTVGYLGLPISNYFVGGASYTNLRQKFTDSLNVKCSILGLSKFRSILISSQAILKTVFVMSVLQNYCRFINNKAPSGSGGYTESGNKDVAVEYYKCKSDASDSILP